ncbi:MAG: hypothetical protein KDK72_05935 [Chlamydiia bacterium]|nr:hypothetical protein [Chlamydiia bacterium]
MTTIEAHKTYSAEAVYDRYREQFKSTLCPTSIPYEVQKKLLQEYQETNKLQGRNITRSQDSTNGQINNCIRILNASVQQIQNDKEEKMAPYRKQFEKTKSTDSIPLDIQWDMVIYYKEMADRLPSSEEMRSLYKEYVNILDESYNQFVQFQIAILDPLFEYIDEKSSNEEETHHTSPEILSFYESAKEYLNEFKQALIKNNLLALKIFSKNGNPNHS